MLIFYIDGRTASAITRADLRADIYDLLTTRFLPPARKPRYWVPV